MKSLSPASQTHILFLLDAGHSASHISSTTGFHTSTIFRLHSKHHPHLAKSTGGHPFKLSPTHIRHAIRLLTSGKVDTAVQVTQQLSTLTNNSISAETVRQHLKKAGLKSAVKQNKPCLTKQHIRARLDFAIAHKDWTIEDWKRVIWSDETKINCLSSDGRKWV
jgi:transposase